MIKDLHNKYPTPSKEPAKSQLLRIVVPCFGQEVAPLFGACRRFHVWEFEADKVVDHREIAMYVNDGTQRVRMLRRMGVHVLICNGIEERIRLTLEAEGIKVIDGVLGLVHDALYGYLAGRIHPQTHEDGLDPSEVQAHTADLVEWTRELFQDNGWNVRSAHDSGIYPTDLVAELQCPICGKPVRVAICCGAHAYKVDEELLEFRRVTSDKYHSRVYVNQALGAISRACSEYEIELLDPSAFVRVQEDQSKTYIPPLHGKVSGHEKLNKTITSQG